MTRTEQPTLETERLLLRMPRLEDAEAAAEYLTDPAVMRFLGGRTVPRDAVEQVVQTWLQRWEDNDLGPFAIVRRSDCRWVGRAGINVWDGRTWTRATLRDAGVHARPELGWALTRAYWGNGYATEAARAVRSWARAERGVGDLISLIAPDNTPSQRVAERLGARPAGRVELFDSGDADVWVHPR